MRKSLKPFLQHGDRITTTQRSSIMTHTRSWWPSAHQTTTINNTTTPSSSTQAHPKFKFSTYPPQLKKSDQLPPRPTLPESDLKHVYLKGSGPGGQKINKTSSAVQLTHLPTGIVVKSQATRSRTQNHTIAKRILAEKIEYMEKGGESRVAKKIERVQRKKASSDKKKRRKYRKLEEGKVALDDGDVVDGVGSEDGDDAVIERAGKP